MSTVLDMTIRERDLKLFAEHSKDIKTKQDALAAALFDRDTTIVDAVAHGASMREVAAVAGVSHQRVAQIVAEVQAVGKD